MQGLRPDTVELAVRGPIARADLPGLCDRVCAILGATRPAVALCDVRGVDPDAVTVDALARLLLPCARVAFGIAALSGLVLFATAATTFAATPLFYVKMAAIVVAVSNTTLFHRGVGQSIADWNTASSTPAAARGAAMVSLVAWTFALVCGRWLAYV